MKIPQSLINMAVRRKYEREKHTRTTSNNPSHFICDYRPSDIVGCELDGMGNNYCGRMHCSKVGRSVYTRNEGYKALERALNKPDK